MRLKDFALPIAMLAGVAVYYVMDGIGLPPATRHIVMQGIGIVQPLLIFTMLFITFCKIDLTELRPRLWHFAGLAFQCLIFGVLALASQTLDETWRIIVEGAMVCLICPTATAAAVITHKLGGNAASLTTYTVLINLATAFVVAFTVPVLHPQAGVTFITDFTLIILRVMPLLFMPIVAAAVVRRWFKAVPRWLKNRPDLAFHVWCFALMLAIAVTVRSIDRSDSGMQTLVGLAAASAVTCAAQFAFGRWIGARRDRTTSITAGQALGQKNTVFAIWMGYTFFTPVTSIAGGLYSIWHNLYNSWQLWQMKRPARR